MKTLFLTSYDAIQIKNLLRTDFLVAFARHDVRVVLLVPEHKYEYYQREFAGPLVVVRGVATPRKTRLQFLVELAAQGALHTHTVWSFYVQRARVERRYAKWLTYLFSYCVLANPLGRALIRGLNNVLASTLAYERLFDEYHPELVFAANITAPLDRILSRAAKKRGIPVLGANKSWDTLTSKGYLDIRADAVIAQNAIQAKELRRYQKYDGRVIVAGYPWFDFFLKRDNLQTRSEFCETNGLDPTKKIILYFLSAKFINPFPEEQIELLDRLIEQRGIEVPAQVLVAPRPKYPFDAERIRQLKHVVVYLPQRGLRGTARDWEESDLQEINEFRNRTFHADLIVNTSSTMSIEGSLMDRPVISLNFDPRPVDYWRSVRVRHQDEHWLTLMRSGGVVEVANANELTYWINQYLQHPEMNHAARAELIRQQAFFTEPKATRRWVELVLEFLATSGSSG